MLINDDDNIIIDKISLNYFHLYAIGRKFEKGNYKTKLFSLETNNNQSNKIFILKEINFNNLNYRIKNNSNIIPLQILIEKNKVFFFLALMKIIFLKKLLKIVK